MLVKMGVARENLFLEAIKHTTLNTLARMWPVSFLGGRNLQIEHEKNTAKYVSFLKFSRTSREMNRSSTPTHFDLSVLVGL